MKLVSRHLTLFLFLISSVSTQAQDFQWVKNNRTFSFGNSNAKTYGLQTLEDHAGNVITMSLFTGGTSPFDIIDVDPGNNTYLISDNINNDQGGIIQKLDKYGNFLWAFHISSSWMDLFKIAVDGNNNIFVFGNIQNSADLDPGPGNQTTTGNFIAKYDPSGNYLWSWSCPNSFSYLTNMAIDDAGNIYFVGYVDTVTDIDPSPAVVTITSTQPHEQVIFKWDAQPKLVWVKQFGDGIGDCLITLTDNQTSIATVGQLYSFTDLDPGPAVFNLPAYSPGTDLYICKYDTSGNFIWGNAMGAPSIYRERANAICSDIQNNIIISGTFNDSINFNPQSGNTFSVSNGSNDCFISKFNSSGNLLWGKTIGNSGYEESLYSVPTENGGIIYRGLLKDTLDVNPNTGVYNLVASSKNSIYLAKLDAAGNFLNAGKLDSVFLNISWNYSFTNNLSFNNNHLFFTGGFHGATDINPSPNSTLIATTNNWHSFTAKIPDQSNLVTGVCFSDANNNGVFDATETPFQYVPVKLNSSNSYTLSDSIGRYALETDSGNYVVAPFQVNYFNNTPAQHTGNFNSFGNSDTSKNFAFYSPNNINDLEIEITNVTPLRINRSVQFFINYKNAGTNSLTADIKFVLDSAINFTSSVPVQNSINGDTVYFTVSNLLPQQTGQIILNAFVPISVPLNSFHNFSVIILPVSGDQTPSNNSDALRLQVIGSFDPNDKQVEPSDYTFQQMQSGDYLYYTIRFQNTGNDTAFNIHIIDTLDQKLDYSTFQFIGASHSCIPYMNGNGILDFRFYNINLPDSNTNESLSHGFIKFRIKPNSNLSQNDIINNQVFIYFDFNAPVATNIVSTSLISGFVDHTVNDNSISLFPNPSYGIFKIAFSNPVKYGQVELYDVFGKLIYSKEFTGISIELTFNNSTGIYFMKCYADDKIFHERIVILK